MNIPPLLHEGNKVVIVAPAGKLKAGAIKSASDVISSWGLEVVLGKHVYNEHGYFSGSDSERLLDLQTAIDDSSVAVILCARGGYGMTRILPEVNFDELIGKPKWLVGFSDITAMHLQLQKQGIASIHGPMATSFNTGAGETSIESLKKLLFDGVSSLSSAEPSLKTGEVTARITGGNLSLVVDSLGTANEIDTRGKILFLEEVGEKTYKVDRMLYQLLRANKLKDLSGLVIGHFSDIGEGSTPLGVTWKDCFANITRRFSYPVSYGWSIGHEAGNMPLVMGGEYKLEALDSEATLTIKSLN